MIHVIIFALLLHFIADFILQSREMGKRKSQEFKVLLAHIGIQLVVFWIGLSLLLPFYKASIIALGNSAIHGLIDWNIWRGYKWFTYRKLKRVADNEPRTTIEVQIANFKYWEDELFYTTIGFDQFLHTLTIVTLISIFY